MPEIVDHLDEAIAYLSYQPRRAQAYALIAIAKELRRMNEHNDYVSNGPR